MARLVRLVFMLAVLLVAYGLLTEALPLMNLPSDRALYGGVAMVLGLILLVPIVLNLIWRKQQ